MKIQDALILQSLYKSVADKSIPINLAYKLNLLVNQYEPTFEFYANEMSKIQETYGLRDDNGNIQHDGNSILITPGTELQVQELLNNLNNLDAPLPTIQFTLEELQPLNLTVAQLHSLMSCIKKPQD